jgi:hypothetical protein
MSGFNDTEEERKTYREKAIKSSEDRGWILIGEVEWGEIYPFMKYSDERPVFFYTRTYKGLEDKIYYEYTFGLNFTDPTYLCWNWSEEKRYSINTLLTSFISQDLIFQASPDGRYYLSPEKVGEKLKIRLCGYKDWLYPDIDYLNQKINMDELELKFRTDKEKNIKNSKSLQENSLMTKEEIKNWKIIV